MSTIRVAIDGPSGAGKSSLARAAAAALGFLYVDTGAIYRTVGLSARDRGVATRPPWRLCCPRFKWNCGTTGPGSRKCS